MCQSSYKSDYPLATSFEMIHFAIQKINCKYFVA